MRNRPLTRPTDARLRAMARQMASRDRRDDPDPDDVFGGWRAGSITKAVRGLGDRDAARLDAMLDEAEKLAVAEEKVGSLDG